MLLRPASASYLQPYRSALLVVVVLQFVGTVAMLYLPSLNADIIDQGVATGDTGYILRPGGVMLVVSLVQIACSVGAVWFAARTAMGFGRDVRAALFHRVGTFSAREVQHFGAPSLITRETNDVQQVQMLVLMGGTLMVSAPIMMVGGVVMAMREDVGLSWLVAVGRAGAGPLRSASSSAGWCPSFRLMQERIDEVNRLLREQITGIRVVRAFVREEHETARFARRQRRPHRGRRTGRPLAWPRCSRSVMLVVNVASVAVLWFGGHRVDDGQMEVGALTAFLAYLMQILMSVMMATFMLMMVPRSAVCADRIAEVLDTETSVAPPAAPGHRDLRARARSTSRTSPSPTRARTCRSSPTSPSRRAPGRRSRSSARPAPASRRWSTWCPRLFDATARPGAASTASTYATSTRSRSGRGSAWCRSGRSCSPAPSPTTCATASPTPPTRRCGRRSRSPRHATSWRRCPRGSTPRSPRAAPTSPAVSGSGWRSRGRCPPPEIYLFDDSFSALDLATDARLRAALRPVTRDATVVIVAQRVSTIRDADLILVLEDGAGRRSRHPRRSCSTTADLPGDRRLPAQRGGGGMSDHRTRAETGGPGR